MRILTDGDDLHESALPGFEPQQARQALGVGFLVGASERDLGAELLGHAHECPRRSRVQADLVAERDEGPRRRMCIACVQQHGSSLLSCWLKIGSRSPNGPYFR